jgi:D-alanine transfer protein
VLFVGAVAGVESRARFVAGREIAALGRASFGQKARGLLLQRTALQRGDVLPLYGSSEVADQRIGVFHAKEFFSSEPSGFSVFAVGGVGIPPMQTMVNLGALGNDLRGKKVAISLPADWFVQVQPLRNPGYAANFSPLQALEVLLTPSLSDPLKRRIAARLLQGPEPLESNRLIALMARQQAERGRSTSALRRVLMPVSWLQLQLLEAQDAVLVNAQRLASRATPRTLAVAAPFDWPALVEQATLAYTPRAAHNPFGIADDWWKLHHDWIVARDHVTDDERFLREISVSEVWGDLELLCQTLNELGARPLILSMPFDGKFLDYSGVSADARRQVYARLRDLTGRYGIRSVILDDHETDPYFFYDEWSHLSPKGWVFYDQALDAFYHDASR